MKKQSVKCPVCGRQFNPLIPYKHIKEHHPDASDHVLVLIRDARRTCFGQDKPIKERSIFLTGLAVSPVKSHLKVTAR